MGDGATKKWLLFLNVKRPLSNKSFVVTNIAYCSNHTTAVGNKFTTYLANKFLPNLLKHDTLKALTDVIFFDGTSNFQKSGEFLSDNYPWIYIFSWCWTFYFIPIYICGRYTYYRDTYKKNAFIEFLDQYHYMDHLKSSLTNQIWQPLVD